MEVLNSTESIYLRMERDGFPCDIAGLCLLEPSPEGALPFAQVRALFDQRAPQTPLMTRMLSSPPMGIGEDHWVQAEAFDVDAHVHHAEVPEPGDLTALLATVLEVSASPLNRTRPLWEAWYLTGMPEGAAALVLRTHHASIDGTGIMQLIASLFTTEPTPVDPGRNPEAPVGEPYPSTLRRALSEVPDRLSSEVTTSGRIARRVGGAVPTVVVGMPVRLLRGALSRVGALTRLTRPDPVQLPELPGYIPSPAHHPPMTVFNQHIDDPQKSMAVVSLPLEKVRQVRTAVPGVTVNDVLFALVTGTLRDYLDALGELPGSPLRATCPANIRAAGDRAGEGNHITTMWLDLPVHLTDPVERLRAVSASAAAAKAALAETLASWDALADVGDLLLPGVVSAAMAFAGTRAFGVLPPTQNLTVSTLAGSRRPLYLVTREITHMYARTIICPPINLFVQALSYNGKVDVSITTLEQVCPNPKALADGMVAELERLSIRL
jgi:WS/DGAT/MGAT family acyltransferase